MKKRKLLMLLAFLGGIVLFGSTLQAREVVVPNGDFQTIYEPDTTNPCTIEDGTYFGIPGQEIKGPAGRVATYADGTTGTGVFLPDWVVATGSKDNADIMQGGDWGGPDGSGDMALLCFASWGGPTYVETAAPLSLPIRGTGGEYELSCEVYNNGGPVIFELLVDGVALTPDTESSPELLANDWVEFTRTYSSMPDGDATIMVGTRDDEGTGWTGNRVSIDNVKLNVTKEFTPADDPGQNTPLLPGDINLSWANWLPADANLTSVYVDVYFGTDPCNLDPIVTAGENLTSHTVNITAEGQYYWQIKTDVGEPNMIEDPLLTFTVLDDPAPKINSVSAAQVTWSGEGTPLVADITNLGASATIINWTAEVADPNVTIVEITDADTATPIITITKANPGVETVVLTISASDALNPEPATATVEIDVYDDACQVAREVFGEDNLGDINKDCDIDMTDLATIAQTWLTITTADGPGATPDQNDLPIVTNGDFAFYNAETGARSVGPLKGDVWVSEIGLNKEISANGPINFADGTVLNAGDIVDIPGWISPIESPNGAGVTNGTQAWSNGYDSEDGTSCLNSFGAWSSQNGGLAQSDAPLALPIRGTGGKYTLSAIMNGNPRPFTFDLYVDGTKIEPDELIDPAVDNQWEVVSRTYNSLPVGDIVVIAGNPKPLDPGTEEAPGSDRLTGARLRIDNIILDVAIDANEPTVIVDAGQNTATWTGEPVTLTPTVTDGPTAPTGVTYLWTAYPANGVVFEGSEDPNQSTELAPTVTFTKEAGDMASVRLTLSVSIDGTDTICSDTVRIDVYDDGCLAGKAMAESMDFDPGDINFDCKTNLLDFAEVADAWLVDYNTPEPTDKPVVDEDIPEEGQEE